MSASEAGFFKRLARALMRILSAKWQADVAKLDERERRLNMPVSTAGPAATTVLPVRSSASLAARLTAVSKLNAPIARAPLNSLLARDQKHPRPVRAVAAPKIAKQTILLTTVAVRAMKNKPGRCATVIDLATARHHTRAAVARKAA